MTGTHNSYPVIPNTTLILTQVLPKTTLICIQMTPKRMALYEVLFAPDDDIQQVSVRLQ